MENKNCTQICKRILELILKIIVFSMTLSIMFSIGYSSNDNWWDNNFEFRKQIEITNPSLSSQTDFVAYLDISKETDMQADYDDLRFTSGTCTGSSNSIFYDYEIGYSNTSQAVIWIKIPTLSVGTNNICMYYGNSGATSGASTTVWNNYGLVYHMETAGNDFSPNNRDKVSNVGTPVQGTDWLGYKETFDGNDAWNLQDLAYWEQGWSTRTHEVVFETSGDVTTRQVIFSEGGGTNGVTLYILSGQLYSRWWSESTGFAGGHINTTISTNSKYYVSMSYNYPGEYNLYVNGVKINGVATSATMNAHSGNGGIAYTGGNSKDFHDLLNSGGHYFDGTIHELFVYDTTNSNDSVDTRNENLLNHGSNTVYNSQEQWLPIITTSIDSPNPTQVYFIEQDNSTIVQTNISCSGPSFTTCSTTTSKLQIKTGPTTFADVSTSSTIPAWTNSTLSQTCLLNGGDSCILNWNLNVTDAALSTNIFRIITNSSNTLYSDVFSQNLTIKVLGQYALSFNYTSYSFPSFEKLSGDRSISVDVKADKGINNNVIVNCISGDCARITDNFVDGNGLTAPSSSSMTFTCEDDIFGSFSAIYRVISNEYPSGTEISLSCNVNPIYGPINTVINSPSTTNITDVGKDILFELNSTTSCIGICGEISSYLVYESNFGDFSDGDLTVTVANTIVNDYTYLIDDELTLDNTLLVNDITNFGTGDEILIWQVQNGSESGIAGTYEFRIIREVQGNNLILFNGLENDYYSGNFDMVGASVTQIVRVPNFKNVTISTGASITAPAWDGYSGGIVVFRSNILTQIGTIDVSAKGFRGGDCNGCGNNAWGDQGEGYLGTGIGALAANGNGGGGGYGPSGFSGEPGAGGGLGTSGSNGISSFTSIGGTSVGDIDIDKLFFGGGAGGGGDDDLQGSIRAQYVDGAGTVIVFSKFANNVSILANGENGVGNSGAAGTTGGGAGGTIWLTSENVSISQISAIGGTGFVDADDNGGNGGVGRIRLDYFNSSGATPNPVAGKIGNISFNYLTFVPTLNTNTPFYTTSLQPQICNPIEDGSCNFVWFINATGQMFETNKFNVWTKSNLTQINSSIPSNIAEIRIFNDIPEIVILSPLNNSKLLGNNVVSFRFNVTDLDDGLLSCKFYLDGINLQNKTCNDGNISIINVSTSFGIHNWSVYVQDTKSGSFDTGNFVFRNLPNQNKKNIKSISRIGSDQYLIDNSINNFINHSSDITSLEFVETKLTAGSFSMIPDFTNLTFNNYVGINYGFDFLLAPNSNVSYSYSVTSPGFRRVEDLFVLGLE